jgi:hypothetical protein
LALFRFVHWRAASATMHCFKPALTAVKMRLNGLAALAFRGAPEGRQV